jgi:hypothetical protein
MYSCIRENIRDTAPWPPSHTPTAFTSMLILRPDEIGRRVKRQQEKSYAIEQKTFSDHR